MIGVTLILQARPGAADELAAFWKSASAEVLVQDPGCRLLHVQRSAADDHQFAVFEIYGSQADLDAHNASELSARLLPPLQRLLAAPPQIVVGPMIV